MKNIFVYLTEKKHCYEIKISNDLLDSSGEWAKKCLPVKARKIVIVSNAKVFGLYGNKVKNSFESAGYEVCICEIGDGEKHKNFKVLENTLRLFSENKLKRTDAVIALGGGVVGDLAGFAAAIYLRGVAFLQIPTTLLAMIDSSVGGKTAVNTEFGKNLIGAFFQPAGVLIDVETLQTLPRRELTAGFCEAVKQGAIANRKLFDLTAEFLSNFSTNKFKTHFNNQYFLKDLQNLLAAQVNFKAAIVMNDERENTSRKDAKSRKILNFGHTVGHALEKITDYRLFKHGEAVGYGILAAGEIAKNIGILDKNNLQLLNDVVGLTGRLPKTDKIDIEKVIKAFDFDKKSSGEFLEWILLKDFGKPKIVESKDIPASVIQKSLAAVLNKS